MKIDCTINDQENYAVVELIGKYEDDAFLKFYRQLVSADDIGKIKAIIWDATQLNVGHVTIDMIRDVIPNIQQVSEKRKGGRAAWVVGDDFGFGMGRTFELMAGEEMQIEIMVLMI
jgi:hypothetical protein